MPNEFVYDDRRLQQLFSALDAKKVAASLRWAFRVSGGKIVKQARAAIRAAKIHNASKLARGYRVEILKKGSAGFKVTASTGKRGKYLHTNRFGKKVPALLYLELGTPPRETKKGTAHSTGAITPGHWLKDAIAQKKDEVTKELDKEILIAMTKTARKYGCTV